MVKRVIIQFGHASTQMHSQNKRTLKQNRPFHRANYINAYFSGDRKLSYDTDKIGGRWENSQEDNTSPRQMRLGEKAFYFENGEIKASFWAIPPVPASHIIIQTHTNTHWKYKWRAEKRLKAIPHCYLGTEHGSHTAATVSTAIPTCLLSLSFGPSRTGLAVSSSTLFPGKITSRKTVWGRWTRRALFSGRVNRRKHLFVFSHPRALPTRGGSPDRAKRAKLSQSYI